MQKKRVRTSGILDKLHRGFVFACIGVTLYGAYIIGGGVYKYYAVTKPELEKTELQKLKEESGENAKETMAM